MRRTFLSVAVAAMLPLSAHAIEGDVIEPGVKHGEAYALSLFMCTTNQEKCHEFPVTEETRIYALLSKETCLTTGRALALMKAQEGATNVQPPIPLYKVECRNVNEQYKMSSITNTYTSKDFGLKAQ